jgi:ABC-type cobalamin/Fe3+-siderophores transport system ATPase subunit
MTLQAYQLACTRGERQLFNDINFDINAGDAMRVAGANGSGKTSLLRMLCGLAFPAAGEVRWNGRNIRAAREEFGSQLIYLGHANGVKTICSHGKILSPRQPCRVIRPVATTRTPHSNRSVWPGPPICRPEPCRKDNANASRWRGCGSA